SPELLDTVPCADGVQTVQGGHDLVVVLAVAPAPLLALLLGLALVGLAALVGGRPHRNLPPAAAEVLADRALVQVQRPRPAVAGRPAGREPELVEARGFFVPPPPADQQPLAAELLHPGVGQVFELRL